MKTTLSFTVFLLFCSGLVSAQQYLFGKVVTEENNPIVGVQVVNMRTNEITVTDTKGIFMIAALSGDKIRVVSQRFVPQEFRAASANFEKPVDIVMLRQEVEIPEVKIAFVPSGDLKKDVQALKQSGKVNRLKSELNTYMQKPPAGGAEPKLSMPQTLAMGPNYSAGQVNVLGLAGAVAGLIHNAVKPKPIIANYYETEAFFAEVRTRIDRKYFTEHGLDDFRFDELVAYANMRYNLATKYRGNFDEAAITSYLKSALKDFLMLRDNKPSGSRPTVHTADVAA